MRLICFEKSRLRGAVAIGLCWKILALAAGGVGTWIGVHEYRKATVGVMPQLVLSAVVHADQQKWCFEKPIPPQDFSHFVTHELKQYVTQITHVSQGHRKHLYVTWQATPHVQCQFIFSVDEEGIRVKRRRFAVLSTVEGTTSPYHVKDSLSEGNVWAAGGQSPEDLGVLPGVSEADITALFPQSSHSTSPVLSLGKQGEQGEQGEQPFLRNLFLSVAPSASTPSPGPSEAETDFKNTLMQWMYGSDYGAKQKMYYPERY